MKNEFTELHIESDDNSIGIEELYNLCGAMSVAAQMVAQTMLGSAVQVRISIIASPRPGSIIIILAPHFSFNFDFSELRNHANREIAQSLLNRFSELAGIAAFGWMALFGGRGILDLFRRKQAPPESPSPASSIDVREWLTNQMLRNTQFLEILQKIVNAAAGSKAKSITITVDGEDPVIVWDQSQRTEPGILFPVKRWITEAPSFVKRRGDREISGKFRGQAVKVIVVEGFDRQDTGNSSRLIAIWLSRNPVPIPNGMRETFVTAEILSNPNELELNEAVPPEFEGAAGVILVIQSGAMA